MTYRYLLQEVAFVETVCPKLVPGTDPHVESMIGAAKLYRFFDVADLDRMTNNRHLMEFVSDRFRSYFR